MAIEKGQASKSKRPFGGMLALLSWHLLDRLVKQAAAVEGSKPCKWVHDTCMNSKWDEPQCMNSSGIRRIRRQHRPFTGRLRSQATRDQSAFEVNLEKHNSAAGCAARRSMASPSHVWQLTQAHQRSRAADTGHIVGCTVGAGRGSC